MSLADLPFQTKVQSTLPDDIAPDGSEIRLLCVTAQGSVCHCTLGIGLTSKAVAHKTVEEIWYVISGIGEVWRKLGEREAITAVQTGVSLTIPTGAHFQFRNTGASPLCILIVTMPAWPGAEEAMFVAGRW